MKSMNHCLFILFLFLTPISLPAQGGAALTSGYVSWTSPAFSQTLTGEDPVKTIYVALPPSYGTTGAEKRYPVVYFLAGFGEKLPAWVSGRYSFLALARGMMTKGQIKEMIIVLGDGKCKLDGSFYMNSPVTGNWEDFYSQEVPEYVDRNYRTLATTSGRAVAGHSMGGFGALNLAMKHPQTFGTVYAHCPGLFAPGGLEKSYLYNAKNLGGLEDSFRTLAGKTPEEALAQYRSLISNLMANPGRFWEQTVVLAYASAFSPEIANPPYCSLAFDKNLKVLDPKVRTLWKGGFGDLEAKADRHLAGLKSLRGIGLMYAAGDSYAWISDGTKHFSQVLKARGITHKLQEVPGDHETAMKDRFQNYLLPFISENIKADL